MTEQTGNNKPNEAEGLAFPLSGNEKLIESVRDWPTITRMSHSTQLEKLVELRDALEAAGKAHTPTDDERAIFEAIADRLGEHSQARNFEIADSGEYETKLTGTIDVEVLAEWLVPTVAGFRRSEVPEPSAEDRIARVIDVLSWRPEHDGNDPARVQDDYMRRAQAADTALAILTEKREGAF